MNLDTTVMHSPLQDSSQSDSVQSDSVQSDSVQSDSFQPDSPGLESHPYEFQVHTFGCKVNSYDSGLVQKRLEESGAQSVQAGHASSISVRDRVHLINSCTVTREATKQARDLARKLKRLDPNSLVVLTGCAAQVDHQEFTANDVDLIVANSHKAELHQYITEHLRKRKTQVPTEASQPPVYRSNIFKKEDLEFGGGEEKSHSRSFLKIQDGCNSFCSFCVIPYARGLSRSIPISSLVGRVNELHALGYQEVVLTGVHIGDYQCPEMLPDDPDEAHQDILPSSFRGLQKGGLVDLVKSLLSQTKIPQIRLTSLEPIEVPDELLKLFEDPRLCRHFHLSIQSANSEVLKQMKRQYGQSDVESVLERIQKFVPGAFIGMDVIAGFPTETEEHFQDGLNCLMRTTWTRLHVFPYSERPGTKAASFPQLPVSIRKQRAKILRNLSEVKLREHSEKQIGQIKEGILLGNAEDTWVKTQDFWDVELSQVPESVQKGTRVQVRISQSPRPGQFLGELLESR